MTRSARDSTLFSLVYASTATSPLDDDALAALLHHARESNAANDITGLLLYRSGRFVQFLEGPEHSIRTLYGKIAQDPRHSGMRTLDEGKPTARQFADWTMAYQPVADPSTPLPPGFRSTFDDLDSANDADNVLRATRELSLWFRVRNRPIAPA
ncbi:BLUF domain-containing protein [Microbacterium sp. SLBN-146]|uniref:BLUF domain-containing protein n=1 Tax=Microbacterium sp. SLBN-146 TaxID=2768457 RepID=UPI00114E6EB6|nr:BLUF domain-containing protein [Microbacterium sp. SLBN-146]TQJ29641.1 FAD-dependent sensor of blue light [Microbacterium sp. SLBN-146]